MQILVLNSGSSSLKFALLNPQSGDVRLSGLAERLGSEGASIRLDRFSNGDRDRAEESLSGGAHAEALTRVLAELDNQGGRGDVVAVGHRVVHGGEKFNAPALVTDEVAEAIRDCIPLAPLHNPANLAGIEAAREAFPNLPHVVVFDTAFHQTMPPVVYRYAVPESWYTEHAVRRYGFHGTSHQYVSREALELLGLDAKDSGLIVAHLGNGSSVTAVQDGQSLDTSMGMTPLEGLVMGTRSGSVDPSLVVYIAEQTGQDAAQVTNALNKESGLLGLSGMTNDMRELEEAAHGGHEGAKLAMDKFIYRLAQTIAGYVPGLKRWDALVFTGGIGENSDYIRAETVKRLAGLGLELDEAANKETVRGKQGVISSENSRVKVVVINTNEELEIARQTAEVVEQQK